MQAPRLHLGCGANVLPGWINIDESARPGVLLWNLKQTLPLPPESVDLIYSEHFIEHLSRDEGIKLLRECHYFLKPGGILRLSTPNLYAAAEHYLMGGNLSIYADVGWFPKTHCQAFNEGMRLWGHQFIYDRDEMYLVLEQVGFQSVRDARWRDSEVPELRNLEIRPYHRELIVEAVR